MATEEITDSNPIMREEIEFVKVEGEMKTEVLDYDLSPDDNLSNCSTEDKTDDKIQLPTTSVETATETICCELCSVTFTSRVYRDEHRKVCRGQRKYPQLVEPFSVPTDIQDLARLVDGKKIYCCSLCEYTTPRGGHMTRHLMSHLGARPFVCIFCGKSFTQAAGLNHHIRIHSGEKPFRCDECDFACGRAIALKRHKNTHTREVMFACTHCDYMTSQTYNLKVHLRTHSGERPYKCAECDYRAGSTCAMRKHERNKHTPKLQCAECPRKFSVQDKLDKHILKKHTKTAKKKPKRPGRKRIRRTVIEPETSSEENDMFTDEEISNIADVENSDDISQGDGGNIVVTPEINEIVPVNENSNSSSQRGEVVAPVISENVNSYQVTLEEIENPIIS